MPSAFLEEGAPALPDAELARAPLSRAVLLCLAHLAPWGPPADLLGDTLSMVAGGRAAANRPPRTAIGGKYVCVPPKGFAMGCYKPRGGSVDGSGHEALSLCPFGVINHL